MFIRYINCATIGLLAPMVAIIITINGKSTKNHEIEEYPFLHKKHKAYVHKRIKINFMATEIIGALLNNAIMPPSTETTK